MHDRVFLITIHSKNEEQPQSNRQENERKPDEPFTRIAPAILDRAENNTQGWEEDEKVGGPRSEIEQDGDGQSHTRCPLKPAVPFSHRLHPFIEKVDQ